MQILNSLLIFTFCIISIEVNAQNIPENNLRLYLNFDNNSLDDNSPHQHDFVDHNLSFGEGIQNEGLALNGIDGYLEIPHSPSLEIKETLTTAIWYQHQDQETSAFYSLIEQSTDEFGGHSRYGIWLFGQNKAMACIEPDTCTNGSQVCQRCIAGSEILEEGEWYHIASTYNGDTLRIYINGVLSGRRNYTSHTGISTRSFPLTIGTDVFDPSPVYLKGVVDEIRIYDRAFSEEEIVQLYDAFRITTSTIDLEAVSFSYFPNPATNTIHIQTSHQQGQYTIINSIGQILQQGSIQEHQTIDVSTLNEGFYFLEFGEGIQKITQPLIIK